jgi:acyl carrier protein
MTETTKTHEEHKQLPIPEGQEISPCPVCGAEAELWQFSESPTSPTSKFVACPTGSSSTLKREDLTNGGCLLFLPPDDFYRATAKNAIQYWNEFAKNVAELREKNLAERSKPKRTEKEEQFMQFLLNYFKNELNLPNAAETSSLNSVGLIDGLDILELSLTIEDEYDVRDLPASLEEIAYKEGATISDLYEELLPYVL